ncbi:MAG: NAD(P)/FAD-dependent oxidoreductase [Bacteroidales bacterium]
MSKPNVHVLIAGGGAAGMMAAISAARRGARVTLVEKMNKPGRKLSITGKGRCNLTNTDDLEEFLTHIGPDARFLRNTFARFFNTHLLDLLHQLGLQTVTERGGRVFPVNNSAVEVVNFLNREMQRLSVEILNHTPVEEILMKEGRATGIRTKGGKIIEADRIILALGGSSYPGTGSTGDGYKISRRLGHSVREPVPSLVPLLTAGDVAQRLQGLTLKNVTARVLVNGKKAGEEFGEMLFTHFGLSGPVILTLSRTFNRTILEGNNVEISIDLKPALDDETLDRRLLRDLAEHSKMHMKGILKGLLPSSLIPLCLDLLHLDPDKPASQFTAQERKRLRAWLKDFRIQITGLRGFSEAIVTSGGVSTREIDPKTMESKLLKNLYFAGEIIDLDADTGGYNLQIAFSTGWIAGMSAAEPDY